MNAAELNHRLVESLLARVEETRFPSAEMEDRVEQYIRTREEAADYAEALIAKIEDTRFPSRELVQRAEAAVNRLAAAERA